MATLIILLISFCIAWLLNTFVLKNYFTWSFMGRIALAVMLLFTGSAHFYKAEEMIQMIPEFLPNKIQWVHYTGLLEIAAAIGLLISRTAKWTSIVLIFFFLSILPANIIGSLKKVELGGMENGLVYLYFRIPLQLFFIGWTYYFGIHRLDNHLFRLAVTNPTNK